MGGACDRRRRPIHVRRRCLRRQRGDPDHRGGVAGEPGADRGRHRHLSDRLCNAGGHRRPARGHLRHPKCVCDGRVRLHRHLAVVRPGAVRSGVDHGPAGARRDRGADGDAGAGHPASSVSGRRARPRLRHLRHRAGASGRGRLSARRRAGDARSGGAGLAHGVFGQRSGRPRHHRRGTVDHAGGAAPRRHAARHSRRDRAVRRTLVSDRPTAVRPRPALVTPGLAGDGGGRRHRRGVPAAGARRCPPRRHAADRSRAVVRRCVHARSWRGLLLLSRQPVVLSGHDHVHAEGSACSAAAGRPGVRTAGARLRRRLAPRRRARTASRYAGAARGVCPSGCGTCRAGADGCAGRGARRAGAGAGAGDFRLRSGNGDGATVRRGAFHGEAGQRRLGRRNVWYDVADRQRRRCRGHRSDLFRS